MLGTVECKHLPLQVRNELRTGLKTCPSSKLFVADQARPPGPPAFPLYPISQLWSIRESFHMERGDNAEIRFYTHIEPERQLDLVTQRSNIRENTYL